MPEVCLVDQLDTDHLTTTQFRFWIWKLLTCHQIIFFLPRITFLTGSCWLTGPRLMIADAELAARLDTSWRIAPGADRRRQRRTGRENRRRRSPGNRRDRGSQRNSLARVRSLQLHVRFVMLRLLGFLGKPVDSTQDANANEKIKEVEGKIFCPLNFKVVVM